MRVESLDVVQLDWEVLPATNGKALMDHIKNDAESDSEVSKIKLERMQLLANLLDEYNGQIYRSKGNALGSRSPYYVLDTFIDGHKFAIAEAPQEDNATYIVREDKAGGTWQEVLELFKVEAREVGAYRVIHAENDERHDEKVALALQELRLQ